LIGLPKPKLSMFLKPVLKRAINPAALWTAASLQFRRAPSRDRLDDAQLQLYAKVLPGDFLHYGYFDNPDRQPGDISLNEIVAAQNRYGELLLELANADRSAPVLDVGCGMGGLLRMLIAAGFSPVAVSPARGQIAHVEKMFPGIPAFCSKFEDMDAETHREKYATVFTSESLQYLRLPRALPLMKQILKPGGTWVACDYFNRAAGNPSRRLPAWPDFLKLLQDEGWRVVHQRDITPHVLPTLRYIHMWAARFGKPLIAYGLLKLQRKQPGLHHLLGGMLPQLDKTIDENLDMICPDVFAREKQYMLLAMQRA